MRKPLGTLATLTSFARPSRATAGSRPQRHLCRSACAGDRAFFAGEERKEPERRAQSIKEARARRAELVVGREDIVSAIDVLLFERDPVGINFETNTDEYRPEAKSIVIRLPDARNEADAAAIVCDEFTNWFGTDSARPRSQYDEIATEILTLWAKADWGN